MTLAPRVVLVHRRSEYDDLLARRGTRAQAAFFLSTRGRDLDEVAARHAGQQQALTEVSAAIPVDWRRGLVERADLDRFLFAPDDIVVVVGPDGLVANVAKYLDGQPVIGLNPEPGRNPGVLVPHELPAAPALLRLAATARLEQHIEARTMVEATADNGQRLLALNEIYLGHASHQTARYTISAPGGATERQASSGILVGTGTGATGWCRSAWQERHSRLPLPAATDPTLTWFVREAWPSPATRTGLTEGLLAGADELQVAVESDRLVAFGDGIEDDTLALDWGQTVTLRVASRSLRLVR
jgi:hypothetical protein